MQHEARALWAQCIGTRRASIHFQQQCAQHRLHSAYFCECIVMLPPRACAVMHPHAHTLSSPLMRMHPHAHALSFTLVHMHPHAHALSFTLVHMQYHAPSCACAVSHPRAHAISCTFMRMHCHAHFLPLS